MPHERHVSSRMRRLLRRLRRWFRRGGREVAGGFRLEAPVSDKWYQTSFTREIR